MFLWSLFWTVVWMSLAVTAATVLLRSLRMVAKEVLNVFVSLSVFLGTNEHHSEEKPVRLYPFMCEVDRLDEVSLNELYSFCCEFVQLNKPLTIQQFHLTLKEYSHVTLFREKTDGSLRGVLCIGVERCSHGDIKYTFVKVGIAYFKFYYRGGPLLYLIPAYFLLKELILHPLTPLYFGGKSYSYKSYMIAVRLFREFYPRYDKKTPEFEESLMHDMASTFLLPEEEYDDKNFVIKRERANLKNHLKVLSEEEQTNPHIKFFTETNPGWNKGHCLVVLVKFGWSELFSGVRAAFIRQKPTHSKGISRPAKKKPTLLRRFSFQEEKANKYAHLYYEMDMNGSFSPTNDVSKLHDGSWFPLVQ